MINERNFFETFSLKNNLKTYENIRKIVTAQGDDWTTGCLLDYNYFNNYYKLIAIDLRKHQAVDTDPKAVQKINFKGNLNWGKNVNANTIMLFIIEEAKVTILNFAQGTVKVFHNLTFVLIKYQYKVTQYNTLNVKLSNSQLNKLKSGIKNGTEVTLKVLSNVVDNSNDKNNFLHQYTSFKAL